ncbi:MAG: DNA-3-methyladenine glycosylase 2 family protein [Rhodobiaceae bacterium]|nr:DNA-3-methyladenine glycosylase 2 family protein [Rhodobiaceae bacterium]
MPEYWEVAKDYLINSDALLGNIIKKYSYAKLVSHKNPFITLVKSILGQQISVKVADILYQRLLIICQTNINPENIYLCKDTSLQQIGLSRQKINYLKNIAIFFLDSPHRLENNYFLNNDANIIYDELIEIKGIGPWTIDMFLIFHCLKPDILPLKDIGLINSIKNNYNISNLSATDLNHKIIELSKNWKPWRTVATFYLWCDIDDNVVQY